MRRLFLAALLAASPATAADETPFLRGPEYLACVADLESKAEDTLQHALSWRERGGGLAADHCAAMALIELGQPAEAAVRFENIARESTTASLRARAAVLDQAGNAWLLAEDGTKAEVAFSTALKLSPRDPALWLDRARARALRKNWTGAESDLNAAITFDRTDADAYVLRASARSALGRPIEARADLEAALAIAPDHPEALVERGAMKRAAGDKNGARADWIHVLRKAPKSTAAESARAHIEAMDFNPNR